MTLTRPEWFDISAGLFALLGLAFALFGHLPGGGTGYWPIALAGSTVVLLGVALERRFWLVLLIPFIAAPTLPIALLGAACILNGMCI
jgi:hypothetical protein